MSSFVVWDSLRKFDSHAVRLGGKTFSTDPLNLTGVHSFSASGVAQTRAIGIRAIAKANKADKSTPIVAITRRKSVKNAKTAQTRLGTGKKGVKLVTLLTTSNNAGAGNNYRADLTKAALARFSQLSRAEARKASQGRKAAVKA